MAQRTITELIDDIDGGQADETVEFALDGVAYTIDLRQERATALRTLLDEFIPHSRHLHGRKRRNSSTRPDIHLVREWAASQPDIEVADRGRVPKHVYDAYDKAKAEQRTGKAKAAGKTSASKRKAPPEKPRFARASRASVR